MDPKPFDPRPATVVVRRTWLTWLFYVLIPGTQALNVYHRALGLGFGEVWIAIAIMFAAGMGSRFWPRRSNGTLGVDATGLTLDGKTVVRTDRIVQAVRFSRASAAVVRVQRKLTVPIDVELASDTDADDLLQALAKDSQRATASFVATRGGMKSRLRTFVAVIFLPFVATLAMPFLFSMGPGSLVARNALMIGASFMVMGAVASLALAFAQLRRVTRLVVGADGVLARGTFRRNVFYPYREMIEVKRDDSDVVITLASTTNEVVRYGLGGARKVYGAESAVALEACFARIVEARARHLAGESASDLASVLSRGSRDVLTWRRSLEGLLGDSATYRTPALPPDRLWRVLEDPTQHEAARAGAAVALRGTLDDASRGRLRVATAACASSELRGAFEATLDEGNDEEHEGRIERALKAIRADGG